MRQSGTKTLVTEEPYAFIAHVRVCGGAGWVTTGSTRKPTASSFGSACASGGGSPRALGVSDRAAKLLQEKKEERHDERYLRHRHSWWRLRGRSSRQGDG